MESIESKCIISERTWSERLHIVLFQLPDTLERIKPVETIKSLVAMGLVLGKMNRQSTIFRAVKSMDICHWTFVQAHKMITRVNC